jgi:hypothetical protein
MPDEGNPAPQGNEGNDQASGLLASLGLRRATPQEQAQQPPATGSEQQTPPAQGEQPQGQQEPQEGELGDAGLTAIQREREARREAERQLASFKEQVEFEQAQASRSEREKLEAERDRYKSRAEEADQTLLRVRVAAAKKLTPGLALRLQGSTEAEMSADADRLLEEFNAVQPRTGFDGGARNPAPQQDSPEEAHRKLLLQMLGRSPEQTT